MKNFFNEKIQKNNHVIETPSSIDITKKPKKKVRRKPDNVDVFKFQVRLNHVEKSATRKKLIMLLTGVSLFLAACASMA